MSDGGSPFHAGEQAAQSRAGVRDQVEAVGRRIVRGFMLDQHRALFEELPWLWLGVLDDEDRPWASVVVGAPGFVRAPDDVTLSVAALPREGDPARALLRPGSPIAILGIQPETRRRNRANGTVRGTSDAGFSVSVRQSFGNCPKYIHPRAPTGARTAPPAEITTEGPSLSARARRMVRQADTFYLASASEGARTGREGEGVDVSHRGGPAGFVRVVEADGATTLVWPDYVGNYLFNTIGNLESHPRAGLAIVDYASGDLLTLTGETETLWDGDGPEVRAVPGAQRLLRLRVTRGAIVTGAVPLSWTDPRSSP